MPFANVNVFVISSKIQDEDISFWDKTIQVRFLSRSIAGEIGLQKKKKTRDAVSRYAVTQLIFMRFGEWQISDIGNKYFGCVTWILFGITVLYIPSTEF